MTKKSIQQMFRELIDTKQAEIDRKAEELGRDHYLTQQAKSEWFGIVEAAEKIAGMKI